MGNGDRIIFTGKSRLILYPDALKPELQPGPRK
jgi:hypothetical protein